MGDVDALNLACEIIALLPNHSVARHRAGACATVVERFWKSKELDLMTATTAPQSPTSMIRLVAARNFAVAFSQRRQKGPEEETAPMSRSSTLRSEDDWVLTIDGQVERPSRWTLAPLSRALRDGPLTAGLKCTDTVEKVVVAAGLKS